MSSAWTRIACLVLVSGFLGCDKGASPVAPIVPGIPPATNPTPPVGGVFMRGTVSDTAFRPLTGATVEVLDGPQAGLSTTTDAWGGFSMTGAFDDATRFRATREGHVTATRTLQPFCAPCNPNWWIHFTLDVTEGPVNMGGDYTLTLAANSTCTMIPDDMRSRTFTATIPLRASGTPADASFPLGGATFFEDWNTVGIGVAGDYVAFWLEIVVEQIAPNTFLAFGGQAAASVGIANTSTFVLPFEGSIEYCVTTAAQGRYEDCYKGQAATRRCNGIHQLTLTRR